MNEEHTHHWRIVYDDIDGGCIIVRAVCECGAELNQHEIEIMLNACQPEKTAV